MTPRSGLTIVGILCAIVIVAVFWRWTTEPARQAAKANTVGAGQIVAQGQAAAGRDAVAIVAGNATQAAEIDRQSQENRDAILNAPGADVRLDPGLDAAARRAVCLRQSARRDPQCIALLDARPR